jgi:GTP-binding protein Era
MTENTTVSPAAPHCGYVAIVGAPNAGKSTLLNKLVGAKVSIVSKKVQTTRARITAIGMEGDVQLVFLDTPGIFKPKRRLDRAMVNAAWSGIEEADAVLLLIDAERGFDDESRAIIEALKDRKRRNVLLALNKVDAVQREKLLGLAKEISEAYDFERVFMISAEKGTGVDDVRTDLAGRMPAGPWLYPEDQLADVPMRFLAAEITREQVYRSLHDELPYAITVETENWKDQKDGSGPHRAGDLRRARQSEEDRAGRERADDQACRRFCPQDHGRTVRAPRAPVPVREGARGLGRRPRTLRSHGAGFPQRLIF